MKQNRLHYKVHRISEVLISTNADNTVEMQTTELNHTLTQYFCTSEAHYSTAVTNGSGSELKCRP
jgi:hypothetical protein